MFVHTYYVVWFYVHFMGLCQTSEMWDFAGLLFENKGSPVCKKVENHWSSHDICTTTVALSRRG